MEEYITREKNGKYIDIIPIGVVGTNASLFREVEVPLEATGNNTWEGSVLLPPAGKPGYNISFSTDASLERVISRFRTFLHPQSTFNTDDDEMNDPELTLREVSEETIRRLSDYKQLWVGILQDEDPTKLHCLWYEKPSMIRLTGSAFVFNVASYQEEIMNTAFELTSYQVTEEDRNWLRSVIGNPN